MTPFKTGVYKSCAFCNKEFYASPCRSAQKYCNSDCMANAYRLPPILKECVACGKQFKASTPAQFCCSRKCGTDNQRDKVTKVCEQCGKEYQVRNHRKDITRFCSQSCAGKWHVQTCSMPHPNIKGNTYRKGLRPVNAFTSEQVQGENSPSWVPPIECACIQCNKAFYRKPNEIRHSGHKGMFCSVPCRAEHFKEHRSGEQSSLWVGGIQTYRGRNWKRIRLFAIERDNGTCQRCGKVIGTSIPVHHKRPFREFATIEEANRLENLICLCQPCHMKLEPRRNASLSGHVQS